MLTEICAEIKNYFSKEEDRIFGTFAVVDGAITPSIDLAENQYYRICGSVFNDGVHQQGDVLTDEEQFTGAIWKMRIPQAFLELVTEIEAWQVKNGGVDSAAMSPFMSESFGGYSYSKSSGTSAGGASSSTWQGAFQSRLNAYRRIRVV